jgi:hypothetical protein
VLTIEYCKKILNKEERKYSEEEIKQIREYLYFLGELQLNNEEK